MKITSALLISCALALSACAGKVAKTEKLRTVRKVAIIGLDLQQQKSVSGGDLLSIATHSMKKAEATPQLGVESPHADLVYQDLAQKLAAHTGWTVLKAADLRKNPAYVAYFKEKTEGFQQRPIINERYVLFRPAGIVDSFAVLTTATEKMQALAKSLGVDALVFISATVNLNNASLLASVVGNGEFNPSSDLQLFVSEGLTGEKIYIDRVQGPKMEKGEKNTLGMASEENLNILARQAVAASVDVALKEFKVR